MKIRTIILAAAALIAAVSCQDSNETIINKLKGTYEGYSVAESKYFQNMATADQSLTLGISAVDSEKMDILYSSSFGEFHCESVSLAKDGSNYLLSGEGKTVMGMGDKKSEYDFAMEASVSGDKSDYDFSFHMPAVMGGTTVTLFSGEMPAKLAVQGKFTGALKLSVQGSDFGTVENSTVEIKLGKDDRISLKLAEFTVNAMGRPMTFGDIVIPEIKLTEENGSYKIEGSIDTTAGDFAVTGDLTGTVKDKDAAIVFNIKPGSMPMPITCNFEGKRK